MQNTLKRLFFGWEAVAPWPQQMPEGRYLLEEDRHLTLAFLGLVDEEKLLHALSSFPPPAFKVARTGHFTKPIFLPKRHPNVVAWEAVWLDQEDPIKAFQKQLTRWLIKQELMTEHQRDWLPHVTLCRRPFNPADWSQYFAPLPFAAGSIHLYESLGQSHYVKKWSYSLCPAFEEVEHTADIAFRIYGESLEELHHHAFSALAFKNPPFLPFLRSKKLLTGLDDIIIALNESIAYADQTHRCPFKAVSFHGEIKPVKKILQWDMIIDV